MRLSKHLAVLSLFFMLCACDNQEDKTVESQKVDKTEFTTDVIDNKTDAVATETLTESEAVSQSHNAFNPTPELIEKYKGKQLTVIDSSEVILDGSSTLVVTFSVPLNPKLNFSNLLRLVDRKTGNVDGAWELSDNGLELKHRYLQPDRQLVLTIDKLLSAINDSHLESVYQKEITTQDRQPTVGFASSGILLPSKSMSGLPVTTLNVNKIDINFFKIKPEKLPEFVSYFGFIDLLSIWNKKEFTRYADLVYSSRFDLHPKPNAQETILVNPHFFQILPLQS